MLIYFIKFIHILCVLALLGSTSACLVLVGLKKKEIIHSLNKLILVFAFFALITGTFLVYPKHYSFYTPWIQAAYIFLSLFCLGMLSLWRAKEKKFQPLILYAVLFFILICITFDAITKSTFLVT